MAHKIIITLTSEAQRLALLAGQPAARVAEYEVPTELLPRLLALRWTTVDANGNATGTPDDIGVNEDGSVAMGRIGYAVERWAPATRPADAAEAIAMAEAHVSAAQATGERLRAKKAARVEDRVHDCLAALRDRAEECFDGSGDLRKWVPGQGGQWPTDPRIAARVVELIPLRIRIRDEAEAKRVASYEADVAARIARWDAIAAEPCGDSDVAVAENVRYNDESAKDPRAIAARELALAARAARVVQYEGARATLITEHGSYELWGRMARGFLPDDEADLYVRDHVFAALDAAFARYRKIAGDEVGHGDECHEPNVGFACEDAADLSADEFAGLEAVETVVAEALPETATVTTRRHSGECRNSGCPGPVSRVGYRVTLTWHGRELTREYGESK